MRLWSKVVSITASILLCLLIVGYTVLDAIGFESIDALWFNLLVVAMYMGLCLTTAIATVKSRQIRRTYMLLAQYTLSLAAVSVLHGVFRGWYVWMKGYTILFVGYYDVPMEPEELYHEIGLLHLVRLPVPEWNWSVLLGLALLLLLLALGWFIKTISRNNTVGLQSDG